MNSHKWLLQVPVVTLSWLERTEISRISCRAEKADHSVVDGTRILFAETWLESQWFIRYKRKQSIRLFLRHSMHESNCDAVAIFLLVQQGRRGKRQNSRVDSNHRYWGSGSDWHNASYAVKTTVFHSLQTCLRLAYTWLFLCLYYTHMSLIWLKSLISLDQFGQSFRHPEVSALSQVYHL